MLADARAVEFKFCETAAQSCGEPARPLAARTAASWTRLAKMLAGRLQNRGAVRQGRLPSDRKAEWETPRLKVSCFLPAAAEIRVQFTALVAHFIGADTVSDTASSRPESRASNRPGTSSTSASVSDEALNRVIYRISGTNRTRLFSNWYV